MVAHGLRRLPSNRKISADTEREAVAILSRPVYGGFGPTPAPEYLAKEHAIEASLETVRRWMIAVKIWRGLAWEQLLLINMIDDATIRWFARFGTSDSTVENMNLLER